MKKFAPVLAVLGVILIGIVLFSLMKGTAVAPEPAQVQATTTEATSSATSAGSSMGLGGLPVKRIVKAYANPSWDIRLRYDPEWSLSANGDTISISSISASFLVSKGQSIALPARLKSTTTTRTILGAPVEVTRFENPNETYAFYEYFTLRVNKTDYYFKVSSIIDPNPKVEEFIGNITAN